MELIFGSGHSKSRFRKSAQIISNDSTQERAALSFGGIIYPNPDSIRPLSFAPMKVEFNKNDSRKKTLVMTNHGFRPISISALTPIPQLVGMKIKDDEIKPGKTGKIEFEWYGGFAADDSCLSMTFLMTLGDTTNTRFTIPLVAIGTKPKPKIPEKAKSQPVTQKSTQSGAKAQSPTPAAPAPGTQKLPYPDVFGTKFDSTKAVKLDTAKVVTPQNK